MRKPRIVDGDDFRDHVVGQVRAPGNAAKDTAVGEEPPDELGWQRGVLREALHHFVEVNRQRRDI